MGEDDLPEVFTRAQAHAHGLTDRQIEWRVAKGRFTPMSRGIYRHHQPRIITVPPELAAALLANQSRDLVFSHLSAARILGLPKPLDGWRNPEFTATSGPPRKRGGTHVRVAPLKQSRGDLAGVPITTPARTVIDCLRTLPPRDGLAILDAALHRELVTSADLLRTMADQAGWPGIAQARIVLMLGSERRESPLESWTAWAFHIIGLPAPEWQVEIRSEDGRFIARVDCWWDGLAGEADGRSKYALAAAQRGNSPDAVYDVLKAERRREQKLRDAGAEVARWSTADILSESRLGQLGTRIRRDISAARASGRFTGVAQPIPKPLTTYRWPA